MERGIPGGAERRLSAVRWAVEGRNSSPSTLDAAAPWLSVALGLAVYQFVPGPLGVALGVVAMLWSTGRWPAHALAVTVFLLPWYLHPREVAGLAFPPHEVVLALTTLGVSTRWLAGTLRGSSKSVPRSAHSPPPGGGISSVATGTSTLEPAERRGVPVAPFLGGKTSFDAPVSLFLVAALLSLLVTEYLRLSLRELRTLVLEPVLFYYLLVATVRDLRDARRLVVGLALGAVAASVLAISQYLVDVNTVAVEGVRRAMGPYLSPNHLGLLLGRALPFAIAAFLAGHGIAVRWLSPVIGAGLAITFSVGAWLGTAAALVAMAATRGRRALLAVLAALAIAVALATPLLQVERVQARLDPTQGTTWFRLKIWESSLHMVRDHPILGIGMDNFLYRYLDRYMLPEAADEPHISHPHNLLLHFWLQLGVPGAVAAGWLLVAFVRHVLPVARGRAGPEARWLGLGALGSMVDFVVHGLVDNSYFLPDMAMVFWLTLGLAEVLRRHVEPRSGLT
ncbi:MAG TPA: O-antigen ligase family protein [Chloroflexota bacterium]